MLHVRRFAGQGGAGPDHVADHVLLVQQIELRQIQDFGAEVLGRQGDSDDTIIAIPLGRNLARRGAADDLCFGKSLGRLG